MSQSTIAAICTPRGFGGVGIVKISGPEAEKIGAALFRKIDTYVTAGNRDAAQESHLPSHKLKYGVVVRPEDGRRIDEVLMTTMRGPHTYTGEDVVEINAHAGPVVLNHILDAVLKQGARLAEPGEFTRRAFLNGRIDLTQAEAVIDLINAKTTTSVEKANAQMAGHLRIEIERISETLKNLIANNEARIDFPEDIEEDEEGLDLTAALVRDVIDPIKRILSRFPEAQIFRDGIKLAVVGRPNVGKSSLMNCLVKKDRAIVTDIPGTTRDAVEDLIDIQGVPIVVVDTAGLQKTENPVERIGIERTIRNIAAADLVLFVIDEGEGILEADQKIFKKIKDKNILIVINKKDLEATCQGTPLPDAWRQHRHLRVSALRGDGIQKLEDAIYEKATGEVSSIPGSDFAPNLRQKKLLEKSLAGALSARSALQGGAPGELVAMDLNDCLSGLDEILGRSLKEDILGRIFSQFCIGK